MSAALLQRWAGRLSPRMTRRLFNLYPPFRGAGIRVTELSDDFLYVRVEMPLRWYNVNYVGVQFGGSIYAMTDPFFMLIYMRALGPEYVVWDRAARIEFLKPGRRRLIAEFRVTAEEVEEGKQRTG